MACYPWHYFKTNYVVIIILVVSIISFNLAWQYYGGVDVKNAAIDPENSSDTKKEEIIIENYFLFNTVNTKATIHGQPKRVEHMGDTEIPYSIFFDFVLTLSENSYRPLSFDIRKHNSTKFCDDVPQFTHGVRIPKYLLEMPQDNLFTSYHILSPGCLQIHNAERSIEH